MKRTKFSGKNDDDLELNKNINITKKQIIY